MTNLLLFLASVAVISLSGVMMPGPVFAVAVAKGHKDQNAGAYIALGHGVIEFPLMFLIYFGFAQFFTSAAVKTAIALLGGAMLVYMGIQMFQARKSIATAGRDLPYSAFVAGIITTSANPYLFLWWATVGATLILTASTFGFVGFLLLALIHWSGDLLWTWFVSAATFKSRHLWSERVHSLVFGGCAVLLVGFGLWFISSPFLNPV